MDQWLHKSNMKVEAEEEKPALIDMSRYLRNVKEELDQWLAAGRKVMVDQDNTDEMEEVNERLRPEVPASLPLNSWLFTTPVTKADNPWLQGSPSKSSRLSTCSSRSSSYSSLASSQFLGPNKWLVNGGFSEVSATLNIPCSFMEKHRAEADKLCWLIGDKNSRNTIPKSNNPLDTYANDGFNQNKWLKSQKSSPVQSSVTPSPLKAVIDFQKANSANAAWLLNPGVLLEKLPSVEKAFDTSDKIWLQRPATSYTEDGLMEEDLC